MNKISELVILGSDILTNDKITKLSITVRFDKKEFNIFQSLRIPSKIHKENVFFLEKNKFEEMWNDSKNLVEKYGKMFRGYNGRAENIPIEENKDSILIKFILDKIKKK